MARKRVAILVSGRGSNMAALIAAAAAPDYPAEVVLVVSSEAGAPALAKASSAGVTTLTILATGRQKRDFEADLTRALEAASVDIVCLAGFMRVLSPEFVDRWRDRVINIHPSLLPAYPGLDTHGRVLAAGETRHGCTVHLVEAAVDQGRVLAQVSVEIRSNATANTLAESVLAEEHRLYPLALALFATAKPSHS